jgi:hypothetical protein
VSKKSDNNIRVLSIITLLFILYICFSFIIFKRDVFYYRGSVSASELPIILGFMMIMVFNCTSVVWIIINRQLKSYGPFLKVFLLAFCGICFILLVIDKVLIDDIGKQYKENVDFTGEFVMLYTSLVIQLIYTSLILHYTIKNRNNPIHLR